MTFCLITRQSSHSATNILIGIALLTAGCILALVSIFQLQQYLDDRIDRSTRQIEDLAHLPPAEHLKPAMLGYHNLGADGLWLRLLQVLGKKRNTPDEYEWIYHVLDVITTLDPQYDYAYYVGGVVLTNLANRVDLSNRLLEKGFKENPTVWNIPFLLGYNYYFVQGDAAKAAEYIAAAARLPGGPAYLPGLAARMYAEANNPDTALQFLEALWRQTQDEGMREVIAKRAKEVMIERDIRSLEAAVQEYSAKQGHLPKRLQDLVSSGYLTQIPQEPFGGSYEMDSRTGKVTSSTHPDRLKVFRLDKQGTV
jgi:tetratricopeptide (TPR) repeat protein